MKHQRRWWGVLILVALISWFLSPQLKAQTPSLEFEQVTISLWPEYDQPGVLVIYRAELNSDTPLPAQLTFKLPGYVEKMHAVAMDAETGLINISPDLIEMSHEGDDLVLTFPTSSTNVHFEYYDPHILTKQGQHRELVFDYSVPYSIKMASFEVQQPFKAEQFSLTPEPGNTITGADRLQYSTIQVDGLAAGEDFQLSASYQRDTDDLSIQALQGGASNAGTVNGGIVSNDPVNIPGSAEVSSSASPYLGYILLGAGVLLLLGVGGYWWTTRSKAASSSRRAPQKVRKSGPRKKGQKADKKRHVAALVTEPAVAAFCYQCGTAFRNNAEFCHACGAKRRVS